MISLITDSDIVVVFGMLTIVTALALIIVELINFIPDLMLNVLNRMRNKTLDEQPDTLTGMDIRNSLDPNLESKLEIKKNISDSDLFKRFKKES